MESLFITYDSKLIFPAELNKSTRNLFNPLNLSVDEVLSLKTGILLQQEKLSNNANSFCADL